MAKRWTSGAGRACPPVPSGPAWRTGPARTGRDPPAPPPRPRRGRRRSPPTDSGARCRGSSRSRAGPRGAGLGDLTPARGRANWAASIPMVPGRTHAGPPLRIGAPQLRGNDPQHATGRALRSELLAHHHVQLAGGVLADAGDEVRRLAVAQHELAPRPGLRRWRRAPRPSTCRVRPAGRWSTRG